MTKSSQTVSPLKSVFPCYKIPALITTMTVRKTTAGDNLTNLFTIVSDRLIKLIAAQW